MMIVHNLIFTLIGCHLTHSDQGLCCCLSVPWQFISETIITLVNVYVDLLVFMRIAGTS